MTIQKVFGPYQFQTSDHIDCGCEAPYCTPFQNGDTIAFQLPDACCSVSAGCSELNAACVADQSLTSAFDFTQATANISFNTESVAGEYVLKGEFEFAADTKYMICVCILGHTTSTTLKLKIGSVESSQTITGNGNFCFAIDPGVGAPTVLDWGIIVTGGDDTMILTLECMTLCTYREWSAILINEDNEEVQPLVRTEMNNGNQAFELALVIPGEIASGCYRIKLTNDCDASEHFSQCLALSAQVKCQTLLFKYRNENDAFGFDYTTDDTYFNYLRVIDARLKQPTFPDDAEIYTKSNNTNSLTNARVQKLWKVQLVNLPEYIHSAISVMRRHDEFYIDGSLYVVAEGNYVPEWRNTSDLAHSEFEVYDQDFDGVMNSC